MKTTNGANIYNITDFIKAVEKSNEKKMNEICLTNERVLN